MPLFIIPLDQPEPYEARSPLWRSASPEHDRPARMGQRAEDPAQVAAGRLDAAGVATARLTSRATARLMRSASRPV